MIRRICKRLMKIRGRPREIVLGFALGIFIGMTPTMGIQMPIAVFVAALFKWNKISAAFRVWITNPFTVPFIYGITYLVGAKLLGLRATLILPEAFTWGIIREMLKKAPVIFGSMTLGGILIGIPSAVLSYYLSFAAIKKYQHRIKKKVAAQKTRLLDTKEKLKHNIRQRRMKN
jgi:uncharacterized protein (DUF2062 family)